MRRLALVLVLPVLLATAWAAAPALSRAPWSPRAVDFSAAVPQPPAGAAGAASAAARTLKAPKRFDLLGFRWKGRAEATLRVRVRKAGGRWSPWVPVGTGDAGAGMSDPVWAGGADEYQLRASRRLPGLRAHFVNATGTSTRADRVKTALRQTVHSAVVSLLPPVARAATAGQPPIRSRQQWDPDGQCPPRRAPNKGTVRMAFVHHTVSANTYDEADVPGIILSICRFHRNSNGWDDIGYNFLVDRYGHIWEGRAGGIAEAVVGAQAQGWNSVSTGISNIGTFASQGQTPAAIRALGNVIGWKLATHGVPTTGSVTVTSAGGDTNRYPSGTNHTFSRISGHRDGNQTECPGSALYAQLPEIRRLATQAAGSVKGSPHLTAETGAAAVTYPGRTPVSGDLSVPGVAPGGASVTLQRLVGRTWTDAADASVASDGTWSARVTLRTSSKVRARWAGGWGFGAVASSPLSAYVRPKLTVGLTPKGAAFKLGAAPRLSGRSAPWKARVSVGLARKRGKKWVRVKTWHLKTRKGAWSVRSPRLTRGGTYRVASWTAWDARHASGRSRYLVLTVKDKAGGAGV